MTVSRMRTCVGRSLALSCSDGLHGLTLLPSFYNILMDKRALTNLFLGYSTFVSHYLLGGNEFHMFSKLFQNYLLSGLFLVFWDLVAYVYGQQMHALHDFNVFFFFNTQHLFNHCVFQM